MFSVPDNARQDLVTLVPASVLNEISCFVFYDKHPRNKKTIDITICTHSGEIKEYYKRDLVNCTIISSCRKPEDIRIHRNSKCDLFYLISYQDNIALVSSTDKLEVIHKINNVDTFEVGDSMCRGYSIIKIIFKDDAVPLFFYDKLEKLADRAAVLSTQNAEDSLPIITELGRKLTEAKYSVQCNEKVLKDLTSLRKLAAHSNFEKSCIKDATIVNREEKVVSSGLLSIKSQTPWIKACHRNFTAILEVVNKCSRQVDNVHILLHSTPSSTVYTTKLFQIIPHSPYWEENLTNTIPYNDQQTALVLIVSIEELKYSITSLINLGGVISYKVDNKEHLLPFENINLSSLDTMDRNFNVLATMEEDKYNILAVLASSKRTEMCLRHINSENGPHLKLLDILCKHLNMEIVVNMSNVAVHKNSPYHSLHGVMVLVNREISQEDKWIISLFTRSEEQILAFIHCMQDAIPYRIIATTISQRITFKMPHLTKYNEPTSVSPNIINYEKFKTCLLKQTSMTIEYLDECMMQMNESKNPTVLNKIGSEIDIFARGVTSFEQFKNKMLEEGASGISSICEENNGAL